uniref:RsbT co-antagonist protein RsbRD N-terminal domain-containing protein n=1 Tax=Fundidesulfovibrio putealis TaxID=270496 RepID=A0A7C3W8J8_9BACT
MSKVEELLAAEREAIVRDWHDLILDTYPAETAKLWKKGGDPFHNPVGQRIMLGAQAVFDYLVTRGDAAPLEKVLDFLDELIRVRAVQNFTPSQAAGFIFLLKKAIRERLWREIKAQDLWEQFIALESRIDGLALASLDLYAKCREKLFEIKVAELKREQVQLLKRAQLIVGIGEGEPAS